MCVDPEGSIALAQALAIAESHSAAHAKAHAAELVLLPAAAATAAGASSSSNYYFWTRTADRGENLAITSQGKTSGKLTEALFGFALVDDSH